MKLRKAIPEGSQIPKGYGVAWDQWNGQSVTVICYPWGLNQICRLFRQFYWWLARGRRKNDPYYLGYQQGYDEGFRDGEDPLWKYFGSK